LRSLQPWLYAVGVVILLLGFMLVFLGSFSGGNASVGGFVLIGPLPIVFGSGRDSGLLAILSVVAGIIMIVLFYMTVLQARSRMPKTVEPSNP
jgi:uncharacterized membrane protein